MAGLAGSQFGSSMSRHSSGGWEFSAPTGGYINKYTGERMSAAQFDSQYLNPLYMSNSADYSWEVIGTMTYEGIDIPSNLYGRVYNSITTAKNGELPVSTKDILKLYFTTLPVAISLELNGSSEIGWGVSVTPIGGILATRGVDKFRFKSFTSAGFGGGFFGASAQILGTRYYYLGDINNFNLQLFEGESLEGELSFGEGLIGGAVISIVQNPYYRNEFLIGIGGYIGLGAGAPVSGSATWQNTLVH